MQLIKIIRGLVAWISGMTSVFRPANFPVLRSTCIAAG